MDRCELCRRRDRDPIGFIFVCKKCERSVCDRCIHVSFDVICKRCAATEDISCSLCGSILVTFLRRCKNLYTHKRE